MDGRQETIVVDLNEVVKRGRKEKDLLLIANDVLAVPESFFSSARVVASARGTVLAERTTGLASGRCAA